uniref:Calcium-transporting ATPase n=1 Tax=Trypanosoma congolense (strain IL3000) TaxID=1068625 RepID=G0UR58_TRYCI|nr:putative vacuolar-type Ca2+-ATPase [Trypanosoma congolense IL3000]
MLPSRDGTTYGTIAGPGASQQRSRLTTPLADGGATAVDVEMRENVSESISGKLQQLFASAGDAKPLLDELGGVEGVAAKLDVRLDSGISSSSAVHRRLTFGKNALPEETPLTFFAIYRAAWSDRMIILLTVAAVISLSLGLTVPERGHDEVNYKTGWIEGAAILVAVFAVTTASSINDYRKELKFRILMKENAAQPITVVRDGLLSTIDVTEIVVGDLVALSPGLVVPVDGLYVKGLSVVIDESSMTGENNPRPKNAECPIIFSGTVVNTAEDTYILTCAVGESSYGGRLLMESRQGGGTRMTPLQKRLDDLAGLIGRAAVGLAVLLFAILSITETVRLVEGRDSNPKRFLDYFLLCVTIIVVAVPEGLPLAVTIALAYSQGQMQKDNNQVRRLRACETMGNATQICSDKTGTLTQNRMVVVQGYIGMQSFHVSNPGDHSTRLELVGVNAETQRLVMEGIAVNSSSEKVWGGDEAGTENACKWVWREGKGNKTDNALLDFVDRVMLTDSCETAANSLPHQRLREECRAGGFTIFPFTSERKVMSTVTMRGGDVVHHVKGGSDRILSMCDRYLSTEGREEPLTDDVKEKIVAQIRSIASDANRTIGIAYTVLSTDGAIPSEEPEQPLVWAALLGIQDPLRPEVPNAVQACQRAGVTVRMCTGDNLDTAVAIARQCGIYNRLRGDVALTGKDFRNLVYDSYGDEENMKRFWSVLDRMTVMGRSQPLDKQLLVLMLMMRGEVVAVTGDGTNDAPALRLANVGFVMKSGTDIAVKSADIILLDDNFRSVQRAVVWGRTVNDNIRKFLQLQLTANVVSVTLTFVGSLATLGDSSPLTTVQLLWVNLLMDTLAALALATESPTDACLNRGPIPTAAPLVSRRMWCTISVGSALQLASLFVFMYLGSSWLNADKMELRTVIFNLFIFFTVFNMFNARKVYDEVNMFEGLISRSKTFLFIVVCCVGFQVIAVEFLRDFMIVTPLHYDQWLCSVLVAALILVFVSVSRLIPIKEPTFPRRTEMVDMEPEARRIAETLEEDVERHSSSSSAGTFLQYGHRLLARAQWQRVREHVTMRGVSQFWWSRYNRSNESGTPRETYERLVSGQY